MPLSGVRPHDILETIREPLVALDLDFRVVYANRSFYQFFQVEPGDTLGRRLHEVGNGQWNVEKLKFLLEDLLPRNRQIENFEVDHVFPQIGRRKVVLNARSMVDEGGTPTTILLAIQDATSEQEREALVEQLGKSQKLEALGRLAGGVAHDFNNLLTVIKGYVELSMGRLPPEDPVREHLLQVEGAADRAVALTRSLLAFGRKQILSPRVMEINFAVQGIEKLLRRLIPENIRIVPLLAADAGRVQADPAQIDQVLLNLVLNARDAMPHGGSISIETATVELDAAYAQKHLPVVQGSYVMLAVTDTGLGMSKETLSHVFEPFFTTKELGHGTGLGLATVYGIVKQSGGSIWVYSEPGKGSAFKIYLPRVDASADNNPMDPSAPPTTRGHETILLSEDEEHVRKYMRLLLEDNGYQVLEARNGREAMEVVRSHAGRIRLMITDVVMPEMSGPVAAGLAAQVDPLLKVLYLSGYTDQHIVQEGILQPGTSFLEKPFAPGVFLRRVREILDRRRTSSH